MHTLFDVLYFSAMYSYIKGCYSESVMSFAASLERTYEHFIKVTLLKDGVSLEVIDEFWKEITIQSERQYGAFCLQYSKVTGEAWRINRNKVTFRNKIIHNGYIATSQEVQDYANYTTSCQYKILKILKTDFKEECQILYFHEKELTKPKTKKIMDENPGIKYSATSMPSLLKWNHAEMDDVSFSNALDEMKSINRIYGWK